MPAVSTKENYTHIYEKNIKDTKLGKSKVILVRTVYGFVRPGNL